MLLKRGGKDMKKQIKMKIEDNKINVYMNDDVLFYLTTSNKSIDVKGLYDKLDIKKDDVLVNLIDALEKDNKTTLDNIYCNTKLFLDHLITSINTTIENFDQEKEISLLEKQ